MDFKFKAAAQGGFDVNYNGKYMWVRIVDPVLAAVQAITIVSQQEGVSPADLVKSLSPALQDGILAFSQEQIRKVESEAAAAPLMKSEEPIQASVTRQEAMSYLESKIQKSKDAREAVTSGEFYTRISMMRSEAEFKSHPGYARIAAEVTANRGK